MARKAHDQRDDAVAAMRRLSNEHGVREGCRLAREMFPDVPKPSWGRWRQEAVGRMPEQEARDTATSARLAHEVRSTIPAIGELVTAPADVIPVQKRALDFWKMLGELDDDAQLLRSYATTTLPDGTRKVRVPVALVGAHRMRADLIRLALEHAGVVWNTERMRELYDCVIEAIGEVDRDLQKAVLDRLRRLRDRNEDRYGV